MGMTRGDLAKRTGCNAETIRYYEKIGVMPEPLRSAGGYRQYDETHEQRLRFVMRGRELGFAIDDLKSLLDLVDRNAVSCGEVEKLAKLHLRSVREKIRDLKRMEKVLGQTVSACSGKDVPECPLIDTLYGVPTGIKGG
ncbi:MAG: helix-turn-helix domain-containing protein [Gammaproteobacteria bacterium]|nr:helix-turn-helix domain-containing protein [Gammaproteobacteria bacterium]